MKIIKKMINESKNVMKYPKFNNYYLQTKYHKVLISFDDRLKGMQTKYHKDLINFENRLQEQ